MTPDYLRLEQRQKMNALTQEFVLRSHHTGRWQHATGLFGSYQWLHTDAPVTFGEAITGPIGSAIENSMKNAMPGNDGAFHGTGNAPRAGYADGAADGGCHGCHHVGGDGSA